MSTKKETEGSAGKLKEKVIKTKINVYLKGVLSFSDPKIFYFLVVFLVLKIDISQSCKKHNH